MRTSETLVGNRPNTVSESTVSNTELSEFCGPQWVPSSETVLSKQYSARCLFKFALYDLVFQEYIESRMAIPDSLWAFINLMEEQEDAPTNPPLPTIHQPRSPNATAMCDAAAMCDATNMRWDSSRAHTHTHTPKRRFLGNDAPRQLGSHQTQLMCENDTKRQGIAGRLHPSLLMERATCHSRSCDATAMSWESKCTRA